MIENEKPEGVRLDPSNVFEMAMVLGKALKNDPRLVRMDRAKGHTRRTKICAVC